MLFALSAQAVERNIVAVYIKILCIDCMGRNVKNIVLHIEDVFAVITDKMVMLMCVVVIMCRAVDDANVKQQAALSHLAEVSVDSGLANAGMALSDNLIDLLSRNMCV